jgi:hypothetical protein
MSKLGHRTNSPWWTCTANGFERSLEISDIQILGNRRRQLQESWLPVGRLSGIDSYRRTIWIVDAHRGHGKRLVVFITNAAIDNTAIGNQALVFTTTGSFNTGVGSQALARNTEGFDNTGTG